jgi:hypothetical protein
VKAQGYTTTPNNFSLYAPLDSPTFTTKITTPYILLSAPIYSEIQGDYTGRKGTYYKINSYDAIYNVVGDIFGQSGNNNSSQDYNINAPQLGVYRGCFIASVGGWDGANFGCSVSGKYQIHITFYIKSNTAGNKFMLKYFNSSATLIYSQYCLVEGTINSDTLRTFSTILNMTSGGYFNITMTERVGGTTMYFYKTDYTSMKIMLLG